MSNPQANQRRAEPLDSNGDRAHRQQTLQAMKSKMHPHCIVCGSQSPNGLHLEFEARDDGSVAAQFDCGDFMQGYTQIVHGGMVASLLDGAMTHCLFAQGIAAVTAEIRVRFLRPVVTNQPVTVSARRVRATRRLHTLSAELVQTGSVIANAVGKFVPRP